MTFYYYTTYIKFGMCRATYDASQEIRNSHLTREEGQALVRRFDGEFTINIFPKLWIIIGMTESNFHKLCNEFRSPHLWKKHNGKWHLRHNVNYDGYDD